MNKLKRILKYTCLVFIVLLIWNVLPSFFYKPESNPLPLPRFYKKGVYHIHSRFSDGKGSIDEITKAAAALNLDFVILTDHGRPNIRSSNSTSWLNRVLLIGGTELPSNGGHLAVMGFKVPDYLFPPEPQEAIDEIMNDNENSVCFISHPFDDKVPWTDWDISGFTGIEILSSYTEARRAGLLKALIFPLKYKIDSRYALLDTMRYPSPEVKKWDALNETGRYFGIFALDAHAKLPITRNIQLHFPSYRSMFEIMTVYVKPSGAGSLGARAAGLVAEGVKSRVLAADEAASAIISSLKAGNFFNVIEGIASANGFEAFFIEAGSGQRLDMGSITRAKKGKLVILLPFDFETRVLVLKNGTISKQIANKQKNPLEIDIDGPGVYRVEVYVPGNTFKYLPWIMTNPFFVGGAATPTQEGTSCHLAALLSERRGFPQFPGYRGKDCFLCKLLECISKKGSATPTHQGLSVRVSKNVRVKAKDCFLCKLLECISKNVPGEPIPGAPDKFKVEKNRLSQGDIAFESIGESLGEKEEKECMVRFAFKLQKDSPGEKDFWSVMALRQENNFSRYRGFGFEARSDKKRRFWVEFRTGGGEAEVWYRHSFLADPGWRRVVIPFNKFHAFYGEKRVPDLSAVTAIFFGVNNVIAYPGTQGEICIKNLSVY